MMIEFNHYSKYYGSREILNIPDLKLDRGIHWLRGENGAGKSTLLRSVAGISGFKGTVVLNGSIDPVKHPVEYRRKVNYAEAEPLFPPFLSGNDLVQLFSETKSADPLRVATLLRELDMNYLDDPVSSYSSGMLKKLSLVLAFTGRADLILLDEPLITLDAAATHTVMAWIETYYTRYNTSFIITSHQEIPQNLCTGRLLIDKKTVHIQ